MGYAFTHRSMHMAILVNPHPYVMLEFQQNEYCNEDGFAYLGSVYKCTVKYILDKVSRILLHAIF